MSELQDKLFEIYGGKHKEHGSSSSKRKPKTPSDLEEQRQQQLRDLHHKAEVQMNHLSVQYKELKNVDPVILRELTHFCEETGVELQFLVSFVIVDGEFLEDVFQTFAQSLTDLIQKCGPEVVEYVTTIRDSVTKSTGEVRTQKITRALKSQAPAPHQYLGKNRGNYPNR